MTTMEKGSTLNREILGVVVLVFALLVSLSLFSYNPADRSWNTPSGSLQTRNWGGIVGAYLADLLLQGFGGAAYLLCLFLFVVAYNLFRDSLAGIPWTKASGYAFFLWSAAVLMSLVREAEVGAKAGGLLGDFSKDLLISLFGRVGAYLIVLAAFLLGL
ncbi:MAG: DNA translocase FtsK 4TM domain-containing protein, partial [Deltaproteobacteria bacterium]|nr:DNA translocase FtsK 4TM domain-containing protein [Deltaproteobacteria bacterium]